MIEEKKLCLVGSTACGKLSMYGKPEPTDLDNLKLYIKLADITKIFNAYVLSTNKFVDNHCSHLVSNASIVKSKNLRSYVVSIDSIDEVVETLDSLSAAFTKEKFYLLLDELMVNCSTSHYFGWVKNETEGSAPAISSDDKENKAKKKTRKRLASAVVAEKIASSDCGSLSLYKDGNEELYTVLPHIYKLLNGTETKYTIKDFLRRRYPNREYGDNIVFGRPASGEGNAPRYMIKLGYVEQFLSVPPSGGWKNSEVFLNVYNNLLENAEKKGIKTKKEVAPATPVVSHESVKQSNIVFSNLSKELLSARDNIDELIKHVAALEEENKAYKSKLDHINSLLAG